MHLARTRSNGGKLGRLTHLHASVLRPEDITLIDGQPVTTLARTVLDLCRSMPMERSVPSGTLPCGSDWMRLSWRR